LDERERSDAEGVRDTAPGELRPTVQPVSTPRTPPQAADAVATVLVLFVLGVSLAMLVWRRGVDDEAECRALFDRWAEMRLRQAEPAMTGAELEHRKEKARSSAERGDAYKRCVEHADRDALLCSERAGGIDELERCFP
jgi:hypothetical protein